MKEVEKDYLRIKEFKKKDSFRVEERKGKVRIEGNKILNDFTKEYIIKLIWNDTKDQK